jgi:prepilin peptidase CpaA
MAHVNLYGLQGLMTGPITLHFCVVALFMVILGLALLADLDSFRIPNRFCIALVLLYPAHLLTSSTPVDWAAALLLAVLIFALGVLPFSAGWMGGGDVKLLAATGLWLGPQAILPFLAVTALLGGIIAVAMVSRLRFSVAHVAESIGLPELGDMVLGRSIPYGIAIALAGWIVGGPYLLAMGSGLR